MIHFEISHKKNTRLFSVFLSCWKIAFSPEHHFWMVIVWKPKTPWSPCRYRLIGLFFKFLTFVLHVWFSNAYSSFINKSWYDKVTLYPMDLTWKIVFWSKKSKISTFHFLNLSPAVPNFGASHLPTYQKIPAEIFKKWFFLL